MRHTLQTQARFKILKSTNTIQQINTRKEENEITMATQAEKMLTEIDTDFWSNQTEKKKT